MTTNKQVCNIIRNFNHAIKTCVLYILGRGVGCERARVEKIGVHVRKGHGQTHLFGTMDQPLD